VLHCIVDESRKRVIGIMASIFAARKLAQYDGGTRVPATMSAIADALRFRGGVKTTPLGCASAFVEVLTEIDNNISRCARDLGW
jgi:hypothetical protein